MRSITLLPSLALLAVLASGSPAAEPGGVETQRFEPVDASRGRTVPVKVYLPGSPGPHPVVLFSHGLGGSRDNNAYLGNHWAKHGYVGVFLQHPGSDEEVWRSVGLGQRVDAMRAAASGRSMIERIGDVPFVLDQLERWNREEDHPLGGRLDLEHVGMSGHSFGARTTQAMMGEVFVRGMEAAEPRIDAFLAFSPSIGKRVEPETSFGAIDRPSLLMTGTRDGSPLDPSTTPESRTRVYAAMPEGDKYQLVLEDAEHHAFGDSRLGRRDRIAHHHPAILVISTRFWDAYLRGDGGAKARLQSGAIREEAGLVEEDRWEWK